MGTAIVMISLFFLAGLFHSAISEETHNSISELGNSNAQSGYGGNREIIDLNGGPHDVAWVVQLSDLHFSVHHPERALEFKKLVGPSLAKINPSLVLITGDLTDGKSKDLLTMKQDKTEWLEYQRVMDDVIKRSGLSKNIFYDLRGNHDSFGVPITGSSFDFFSQYSINARMGRTGQVNSVTIQTATRKLLFVGFDSTMSVGLRGPTNLFGHPTDELLAYIDSELSQWDSDPTHPVTKIAFGHFPFSFSAPSSSGRTLKDVFLKNSLSAYLCGHLHTRFGKNLRRHHHSIDNLSIFQKLFQLNAQQTLPVSTKSCSKAVPSFKEFWEWEMGDWRKSRVMRILAIDRGFLSFVDIDFKFGAINTIILPTHPVDSRFVLTSSVNQYECMTVDPKSYATIRALVFSASPIDSVVARIYDSKDGNHILVLESSMVEIPSNMSRGDLYAAPWNHQAFEDPSPNRFWLQIETIDIRGRSTLTELRPFSINGLSYKVTWTWKEFLVMGCEWAALYYPLLWSFYLFILSVLIVPKIMLAFSRETFSYKKFEANKSFVNGIAWFFSELYAVPLFFQAMLVYLFYLLLCPWLFGHVFTDTTERGYMTYKGWVVKQEKPGKLDFLGFPDVMVVVLPHLVFVVLPTFLVTGALAAEKGMYRHVFHLLSGKKEDDIAVDDKGSQKQDSNKNRIKMLCLSKRWIRYVLLMVCLAISWKHFKNIRALMKAYDMNPLLHFPVYSLSMPLLLAFGIYKTGRALKKKENAVSGYGEL